MFCFSAFACVMMNVVLFENVVEIGTDLQKGLGCGGLIPLESWTDRAMIDKRGKQIGLKIATLLWWTIPWTCGI